MFINAHGNVLAGSDGAGPVSIDGHVIAENGGLPCWLDDDRAIFQIGRSLYTCTPGGQPVLLDPQGANQLAAGGGVYAALVDGVVRVSNSSTPYPGHYVGAVGPDGGVLLLGPDGLLQGQWVYGIQAFAGGAWRAIHRGRYRPVESAGVAPAQVVDGPIYSLRTAGRFIAYQAGPRVLLSHVDRPVGVVVADAPDAFGLDLQILPSGLLRVGWAVRAGQAPGDLVTFDRDPAALTANLMVDPPIIVPPPKPPVEPPVTPTPDKPEAPKTPEGITDAQLATLHRERAKYPAWDDSTEERRQATAMNPYQTADMLNRTCWAHRAEGLGMQAKPGGTAAILILPDGRHLGIWNGLRGRDEDGTEWGQDVLIGASIGKNQPGRQTPGEIVAGDPPFVAPFAPPGEPAAPPRPPEAPPAPPIVVAPAQGDLGDLRAAVADVAARIDVLAGRQDQTDRDQAVTEQDREARGAPSDGAKKGGSVTSLVGRLPIHGEIDE